MTTYWGLQIRSAILFFYGVLQEIRDRKNSIMGRNKFQSKVQYIEKKSGIM